MILLTDDSGNAFAARCGRSCQSTLRQQVQFEDGAKNRRPCERTSASIVRTSPRSSGQAQGRQTCIWLMSPTPYAANAFRTAFDSICSAASVNRDPLTSPIRCNVSIATGSQRSVEALSANIAMARCSSASRSVHEMSSIVHLARHGMSQAMIELRTLKFY